MHHTNGTIRAEPPGSWRVDEGLLTFQPARARDTAAHGFGNGLTHGSYGIHDDMLSSPARSRHAERPTA